jgi:uncharacterized protein (TIGR02145 family)
MKKIFFSGFLLGLILNVYGQGKFTDPRDGNVYKTITVEGVTWMVENLKYKTPEGSSYFENDPNNVQKYGILYDWKTATRVCPKGWHLPSGAEFQSLIDHYYVGKGWGNIALDTTSFRIQLAGMQDPEGTYSEMDESGFYWTSTEFDKSHAQYFSYMIIIDTPVIDLSRKADIEDIFGAEKNCNYSVRCVKNK